MHTASQLFGGELREPPLNEVEPGPTGWGEVQVEPRALREPGPDERSLMRAVVVQDDVHIEGGRHAGVQSVQKLPEFDRAMPAMRLADDGTGPHIERGEQRRRAMPLVVMRALFGLARLQGSNGAVRSSA